MEYGPSYGFKNATDGVAAGATGRILSLNDIENAQNYLKNLHTLINRGIKSIDTIISSFSNEEIVQSFYASGKYGNDVRERLEQIKNGMAKYNVTIESLAKQTNNYLYSQKELNNKRFNN